MDYESSFTIIGNNNSLFTLNDTASKVCKWFDPTTDLMCYELSGTATFGSLKVTVYNEIKSEEYYFPVTSGMHLKLNCNMSLTSPITVQPGAVVEIMPGAEISLNARLHVFDSDDWGLYVNKYYYRPFPNITSHLDRGTGEEKSLCDAKIIVNGSLNVGTNGALYTTAGGGDITSDGGGNIRIGGYIPLADIVTHCTGLESPETKPVYPARLHNENDSYTMTVSATSFTNLYGRWFAFSAKNEKADHTYSFTFLNGSSSTTTDAIYWIDAAGSGHWNNATSLPASSYRNTWVGTEEKAGITAYYTYTTYDASGNNPTGGWVKMTRLENSSAFGGSDNNMYLYRDNKWCAIGSTDDDCLYSVNDEKVALVGNQLVALVPNNNPIDGAWRDIHSPDSAVNYYVDLSASSCLWMPARKLDRFEKAYETDGQIYIRIDSDGTGEDWLAVSYQEPYFYSADAQNQRTYYEYNATSFRWQRATPRVSITSDGTTSFYYLFAEAMAAANNMYNPTIRLLADIREDSRSGYNMLAAPGSTAYTIDLNGHTLTANVASAAYFLNMAAGVPLTLTDQSDRKDGAIYAYSHRNGRFEGLRVSSGSVIVDAGKIYAENTALVSDNASCAAAAVYVTAGRQLTVNDGQLAAVAGKNAYAIYQASSAVANRAGLSVITINDGHFSATAPSYAYGIYGYGDIRFHGGTINAQTDNVNGVPAANYAYGIFAETSVSQTDSLSYRAVMLMDGGTINATAASYAYGVYANARYISAMGYMSDGTADEAYRASDGTWSNKASAHFEILGGSINATGTKNYYAYGVYALAGEHSYVDRSETNFPSNIIRNVSIVSRAASLAYGVYVPAMVGNLHGGKIYGKVDIENANVYAEATVSNSAYAVYVTGASIWINRAMYRYSVTASSKQSWFVEADPDDEDLSHEAIDATGTNAANIYKYRIGNYAVAAKAKISGGLYAAKSATSVAYAVYVGRATATGNGLVALAELSVNGGTFTSETRLDAAYGISSGGNTTISSATINVNCGGSSGYGAYVWDGTTNLQSGSINVSTKGVAAYGIVSTGVFDANTTKHSHGTLNVYDSVSVCARCINSSGAYAVYASAICAELNADKYSARTEANRKHYFAIDESGKVDINAIEANYYPYRYGQYIEEGVINIYGGEFFAESYSMNAYGVYAYLNNLCRSGAVGRVAVGRGKVNVYGGRFVAKSVTGSNAVGVVSYGNVHIDGGRFEVSSHTTAAEGVRVYDGTAHVSGGEFSIIAGTSSAYGVNLPVGWEGNYAIGYSGDVTVSGGRFDIRTHNGGKVYGVYVSGGTRRMKASKVSSDVARDYACAGRLVVSGGAFLLTPSTSSDATGVYVESTKRLNSAVSYPRCDVSGGSFLMNGISSVKACNTSATQDSLGNCNLRVTGGRFSTSVGLMELSPKDYVRSPYGVVSCVDEGYRAVYPYEVSESSVVTFLSDDGSVLLSGAQSKGRPAYYPLTDGIPEKPSTGAFSYDFAGWSRPLATVMSDAVYTAFFTEVDKRYLVTWEDDKGVEIGHQEYPLGAMPSHVDPEKEGYTFRGWTPAITVVAGSNQTYRATYDVNEYEIVWEDEDGSELLRERKPYGAVLTSPEPVKVDHVFSCWSPAVTNVTCNRTYRASYLLGKASVRDKNGVETVYLTWPSACEAVNKLDSATIKLLQDMGSAGVFTVTKDMTIDLNGHVLAGATSKLITLDAVGKTLTITDTSAEKKGAVRSVASQDGHLSAIWLQRGRVVLRDGTIHGENIHPAADRARRGVGVYVGAEGRFEMSGGVVKGLSRYEGRGIEAQGSVSITGGSVGGSARKYAYGICAEEGSGFISISDAYVSADAVISDASAVYAMSSDSPSVVISHCVMSSTSATDAYGISQQGGAVTTVDDVRIKASTAPVNDAAMPSNLLLRSGYFNKSDNLTRYSGTKKVVCMLDSVAYPAMLDGYRYTLSANACRVTFLSAEGGMLQESYVERGHRPVYAGSVPVRPRTPSVSSSFSGWSDGMQTYSEHSLPVVSGDVVYRAVFDVTPVFYPITYADIDGLGSSVVVNYEYGFKPSYDGVEPSKEGNPSEGIEYIFAGWHPSLTRVTDTATYTAVFRKEVSPVVSYEMGGKGMSLPSHRVKQDTYIPTPSEQQTSDGYHIVGWYKDASLTDEWLFRSDKMGTSDMTLYAKWERLTYIITWKDELGNVLHRDTLQWGSTPSHAALTKASTTTHTFEWKGWDKSLVPVTSDATYCSLGFSAIARMSTLFFDANGGTSVSAIHQAVGSSVTAVTAPVKTGYTFVGWVPAVPDTMPSVDMTCVAQWRVNSYTITFDSDGGSAVAPVRQDYGTTVSAPSAPVKAGYTFAGWVPSVPSTMPSADMTCVAQWTPTSYTITFDSDGGSSVASVTLSYGSSIVAPSAPVKTGYTFAGWVPSVPSTMPSADMTCVAQWTPNSYTITFDANGGTEVQALTQAYGSAITPPVAPSRLGYMFVGWQPALPSTMPASDMTCVAQWQLAATGASLDIVDWLPNASQSGGTLVINASGFATSGWPYSVQVNDGAEQVFETKVVSGHKQREEDRTIRVDYSGIVGDTLSLLIKRGNGSVFSQRYLLVPLVTTGSVSVASSLAGGSDAQLWVKSGVASIDGHLSLSKVVVYPGAELEVNGRLSVSDRLVLRTSASCSASLRGTAGISGAVCYSRVITEKGKWSMFGLPLGCRTDAVVLSNGTTCSYGTTWSLRGYSESVRASRGASGAVWVDLSAGMITGGTGYQITSNSASYREFLFPVDLSECTLHSPALSYTAYAAGGAQNAGWNVLVSPLLSVYPAPCIDPSDMPKIAYLEADGYYRQMVADSILPGQPFYYQSPGSCSLVFDDVSFRYGEAVPTVSSVPTQWLQLKINQGDEANLYLHPDRFTYAYDIGYDVVKLSLSGSRSLLYISTARGDHAACALPDSIAEAGLSVNVYVPQAGQHLLSLCGNDYMSRLEHVYLLDKQTGLLTDLMVDDYAFTAVEGTHSGRFTLTCVFRQGEIPTSVEETSSVGSAQKIYLHGHLYILRDGEVYDSAGRKTMLP